VLLTSQYATREVHVLDNHFALTRSFDYNYCVYLKKCNKIITSITVMPDSCHLSYLVVKLWLLSTAWCYIMLWMFYYKQINYLLTFLSLRFFQINKFIILVIQIISFRFKFITRNRCSTSPAQVNGVLQRAKDK